MSAHVEIRAKVTALSNEVLDALSIATGRDKAYLVREILHQWAEQRVHESTVVVNVTRNNGKRTATERQR